MESFILLHHRYIYFFSYFAHLFGYLVPIPGKCMSLFFQVLYNDVMKDVSSAVHEKLSKQKAKRAMENARAEGKPSGSYHMQDLIDDFEAGEMPSRFRHIYQGHISTKIKGS